MTEIEHGTTWAGENYCQAFLELRFAPIIGEE